MIRLPALVSILLCLALAGVGILLGTMLAVRAQGHLMPSGRTFVAGVAFGGVPVAAGALQFGAIVLRWRRIRWGLLAAATVLTMWAVPRLVELRASSGLLNQAQAEWAVLALMLGVGLTLLTLGSVKGETR